MSVNPFKNVKGNCTITNYKPAEDREKKAEDIKIDFVNGEAKMDKQTKEYLANNSSIFEALASLSGDKGKLERDDLNNAEKLKGIFNIEEVYKDWKAGGVRFVFGDKTELIIDFETAEEAQEKQVKENQAKLDKFNKKHSGKYNGVLSGNNVIITVAKETKAEKLINDLDIDPAVFFNSNEEYKVSGNEVLYNGAESTATDLAYKYTPNIKAGVVIYIPVDALK